MWDDVKIGIKDKKMETKGLGVKGLGLGIYRADGKENGNCYRGYIGVYYIGGYIEIMEKRRWKLLFSFFK